MSSVKFNIDLPNVDFGALNSDEDFRKEAKRLVPGVLKELAEVSAKEAWETTQRELKKVKGLKITSSPSDKSKFIRDSAKSFEPDSALKKRTEDAIVDQLKKHKSKYKKP